MEAKETAQALITAAGCITTVVIAPALIAALMLAWALVPVK